MLGKPYCLVALHTRQSHSTKTRSRKIKHRRLGIAELSAAAHFIIRLWLKGLQDDEWKHNYDAYRSVAADIICLPMGEQVSLSQQGKLFAI